MKITFKKSLATLLALVMLFSCVGVTSSAEATTGFETTRLNCTMYGDSQTQRGFTWYTSRPCDTTIQVVDAGNYKLSGFQKAVTFSGTVSEWDGYYCHKVVVTGLEPGTEYRYRAGSAEYNTWSNMGKFVTDNADDNFSFIAIADVQARDHEEYVKASKVMGAAMDYTPGAEFAINLGDFVNYCTTEEWADYGETFAKANSSLTLVPVAGNHDGNIVEKLNIGWFDAQFNLLYGEGNFNGINGAYYSYDYGNAHFTVINANDMYTMTEIQRNWAINDLTNSDAHWKILLLHRAPYSAGKNILKPDTMAMRKTIIDIVDQTGVDFVFSGHDHMYFRTLQVAGDKVCENTVYVTEKYNGQDVTFAINPEGAVYALPSTAGGKTYSVQPTTGAIKDCADKCFSTDDMGGCFANVTIDGDKLVYRAYVVDDETQEVTQVDEYGIKKTETDKPTEGTDLPTDIFGTLDGATGNFITDVLALIISYIKLIPDLIMQLFE